MDSTSSSHLFLDNISDSIQCMCKDRWQSSEHKDKKDSFVSKECMDRAVMSYLINAGYKEAADKFGAESGIKIDKPVADLENRIAIKRLIMSGDILGAVSFINHVYPELLENKRHLYFRLLQQQTIEMIREKKIEEALDFAQKNLVEKVVEDINVLPDVEHTLTLLAFNDTHPSPYDHLLQPLHRHKVAKDVNTAILIHCDEEDSTEIGQLVNMIIWSQDELENHRTSTSSYPKNSYPRMSNIGEATYEKCTCMIHGD